MKRIQEINLRFSEQAVSAKNCFLVKSKEAGVKSLLFKIKLLKRREKARRLTRTIHDPSEKRSSMRSLRRFASQNDIGEK